MSLWNKQLYVRCPGCWRYFAAPSAFKQHLLHKKGTFRHVPDHIFQTWNCDALWDPAWKEIEESKRAETAEGGSATTPPSPGGEFDRSLAPWQESLPTPPQTVRDAATIKELESQGWFQPVPEYMVEMLAEQAYRAGCTEDQSRQNWYGYIKSVLDALDPELEDPRPNNKAMINFTQIPDTTVSIPLNSRWNREEIFIPCGIQNGSFL